MSLITDLLLDLIGSGIGPSTDRGLVATVSAGSILLSAVTLYGKGRWRTMKGVARIRLKNGRIRLAELHWYEAHGIGKKEFKRKRYLD